MTKIKIEMETFGTMIAELYPDVAPITVANFLRLIDQKFYDGLTFHRIIPNFVIQGGDPRGDGTGGSKDKIKGEFEANGVANPLKHTVGVLSMARSSLMDSASSQFFIMVGNVPHLDGKYASFGKVIEGIDHCLKIAQQPTTYNDRPVQPIRIKTITRV